MHDPSEIRNLPIDIAFGRLQEWLVDRKRVPHDWRKRLAGIRARVASAFAALPRDLHPSLLALDPEGSTVVPHLSADSHCRNFGEFVVPPLLNPPTEPPPLSFFLALPLRALYSVFSLSLSVSNVILCF